jgi:hypothetical protein
LHKKRWCNGSAAGNEPGESKQEDKASMGAEEGEGETAEVVARAAGKRKSMPPVQLTSSMLRSSASHAGEKVQGKQAGGNPKGKHEQEEVDEGDDHQCPTCHKLFASLQVSLLLQPQAL